MNSANKITLMRIFLTPLFFFVYFTSFYKERYTVPASIILIIIYLLAELSDLLDGIVARKYKQVSDLGKIMDPFSDVFSRVTFFYCFTLEGIMPIIPFVLILWREFSMLFVRNLIQLLGSRALAANSMGKLKAVSYFLATLFGLFILLCKAYEISIDKDLLSYLSYILYYMAAIFSLVSFILYLPALKRLRN